MGLESHFLEIIWYWDTSVFIACCVLRRSEEWWSVYWEVESEGESKNDFNLFYLEVVNLLPTFAENT